MAKLEVLVGMIGSGKSTYAQKRAQAGALIVCHDSLTAMLHGEYRYEQGLRECYRTMEEDLVSRILFFGRDVVVDRTHLTRESRQRWLKFTSVPVVVVVFPIRSAAIHAQRRVDADPRGRSFTEWCQVAEHHAEQARQEPLDWRAEGFADGIEVPDA